MNEALRLADALDDEFTQGRISNHTGRKSAAELRRLSAEHEEDQRVIAVWRGRTQRAEAQRDALLEACRAMLTSIERHSPRGLQPEPGSPVAIARAAIKAVEGEKS